MGTARQIISRLTIVATGALYKSRIVSSTGTHTANKGVGVAEFDAEIGDAAGVIISGITHVISGAAVAAGDLIGADSNGKAVTISPAAIANGTLVEVIGVAIDAASAGDVEIRVLVHPQTIVGTLPATAVNSETITIAASETITANQIVDANGAHTANKGLGVALNGGASGTDITIQVKGTVLVKSGAAFAVGDYITADSAGKAVKYDPANVNVGTVINIIGVALQAATDADQNKLILVSPGTAVGTKAA